jgi:predicted 3-demethylubiquinone-9 3-methyltransferase (glyoxalase superfamily)
MKNITPFLWFDTQAEEAVRFYAAIFKKSQQCGWLKDRFGVSWQVVPAALPELLSSADPEKSQKVMQALLQMKKPDITALRKAAA